MSAEVPIAAKELYVARAASAFNKTLIREFGYPTDTEKVVSLMTRCGLLATEADTIREEIAAKHERDPQLFLVYELSGEIVGTVIGGWDGWRGWIYKLAVSEDHRRSGIGSALVSEVVRRLRGLGATRIGTYVFSNNEASAALFKKNGFAELDVKHFRLSF